MEPYAIKLAAAAPFALVLIVQLYFYLVHVRRQRRDANPQPVLQTVRNEEMASVS